MKNNKGFTLLELLICVSLVSIVMVFLFRLIGDVKNEERSVGYIKNNQIKRYEIMNKVGTILSQNRICGYNTTGSTTSKGIVTFDLCNSRTLKIEVEKQYFTITYNGVKNKYKMDDYPKAYYDPVFVETTGEYYDMEYTSILFKTEKKGVDSTTLDDIEIFWISGGFGLTAADIRYYNPETECDNVQCVLDELYNKVRH